MKKKRIWILEIGEPLPFEDGVRLHRYGKFSKYLASLGYEVTWFASTFSHFKKRHLYSSDQQLEVDGVNLSLLHVPGYSKNVSLFRVLHNHLFARKFLEIAHKRVAPDLIFAPVPTVNIARSAVKYGGLVGVPVIVDVRDLWPDELANLLPKKLVSLGKLALWRSFRDMEQACTGAHSIWGVSEGYLEYGTKFAQRDKGQHDHVFYLGYENTARTASHEKTDWFVENFGPIGETTVAFFGTVGRFFALNTVIQAAEKLPNIRFILAGSGDRLDEYKGKSKHIKNLFWPGWLDKEQIDCVLMNSDMGLAPYVKDAKMEYPNKPFEYMSAGLPLVSSLTGGIKHLIDSDDIGVSYEADDSDSLVSRVEYLASNTEIRQKMGARGKELFENRFTLNVIHQQAVERIETLLSRRNKGVEHE